MQYGSKKHLLVLEKSKPALLKAMTVDDEVRVSTAGDAYQQIATIKICANTDRKHRLRVGAVEDNQHPKYETIMDNWKNLQSSISGLNIGQSAGKFAKGFNSTVQSTRERLGQVAPDEITELPQGARSTS